MGARLRAMLKGVPGARRAWRYLASHEASRRLTEDIDLVLKYGRIRPDRVRLPGSRHEIFVDPRESRGRAVLRGGADGQPVLKKVWNVALELAPPGVALDVGANYGEFLFAPDYAATRRAIGIEANRRLLPWLARSRSAHSARDRIELVCALAAAEAGSSARFFVDTRWSGRSSTLLDPNDANVVADETPTTSVDALFADELSRGGSLVFKIDVEGQEPSVVAGMKRSLAAFRPHVGFLEWTPVFFERNGHDAAKFADEIGRGKALFAVFHDGTIRRAIDPSHLLTLLGREGGDVLLSDDAALLDAVVARVGARS